MKSFWYGLFRSVTGVLYRIVRLGAEVPESGPVLVVGNHPNGLVDPALLLHLTARDIRFLGKAPLLDVPVLGRILKAMGLLPVYRAQDGHDTEENVRTFSAVWDSLGRGDLIVLFPEGISHNEPGLQRLKTGSARMALGTNPSLAGEVRIVPVGLVYASKAEFRSRVALQVGEPISVGEFRTPEGAEDRAAVQALTDRIGHGLSQVTIDLEDWDELPLVKLAERIWKPAPGSERIARMSGLAEGIKTLRERDPVRLAEFRRGIEEFALALAKFGVEPDDLDRDYSPGRVLSFSLRSATEALLGVPLSGLAVLYWWPPNQLVALALRRAKPTQDIVATIKGLGGLVFYSLWHLAVTALTWRLLGGLAAAAVLMLLPPLTYLGIRFFERHRAAYREARVFARIAPEPRLRKALIEQRAAISAELDAMARDLRRPDQSPDSCESSGNSTGTGASPVSSA